MTSNSASQADTGGPASQPPATHSRPIHNHPINHIGIAVDNVEAAAAWYGKHFGFRRIRSDMTIDRAQVGSDNPMFRMYGPKLNKVKICFMSAGNGVGFELFEFVDPPVKGAEELRGEFSLQGQWQRGGVFHFCVTAPDPEATARRACEDGAERLGESNVVGPVTTLYLRDPWGMVVEVASCSMESMMANTG